MPGKDAEHDRWTENPSAAKGTGAATGHLILKGLRPVLECPIDFQIIYA